MNATLNGFEVTQLVACHLWMGYLCNKNFANRCTGCYQREGCYLIKKKKVVVSVKTERALLISFV